jgi:hypothetical protein
MDVDFKLPVTWKNKELLLPARLLHLGYIYRLEVELDGLPYQFERDEERAWRVLADPNAQEIKIPDKGLMEAVIAAIDEITG